MSPAAIIFDFDGVIVDSEIVSAQVFSRALTAAGLPTSEEEALARYIGLSRADTLAAIATQWGTRVPADMADQLAVATIQALRKPIPAVPGALAFIAQTAHLPRAIASSSSTEYLRTHLDHLDQTGQFGDHIYSGREHVTRGKPFPDLYLYAARALGVAPQDALVIEDSPVGARAALAAGARVFGLAAGSHARPSLTAALEAEGVERVFASYADLSDSLGLA
ncbi:MAG: hypothetical protein ABS86_03010 [Sphingobium sp. SCN 64-10]|nr:MAG: hypothetical protein ABS86_03010 [Sphingobium sp. SCN 64-10]